EALARKLSAQKPLQAAPLLWLGFSDLFARHHKCAPPLTKLASLVQDAHPVLEALQDDLARKWIHCEQQRTSIASAETIIAIGEAQEAILTQLCDELDRAGRRDLAEFLIAAALALGNIAVEPWRGSGGETVKQRAAVARAAATFWRSLERIAKWDDEHRA